MNRESVAGLPLLVAVLIVVELLSATPQTTRRPLPLTAPGKRQVFTAWCPRQCKLDSPLNWAAVRSIFWVGGKWIMEIPDCMYTGMVPGAKMEIRAPG